MLLYLVWNEVAFTKEAIRLEYLRKRINERSQADAMYVTSWDLSRSDSGFLHLIFFYEYPALAQAEMIKAVQSSTCPETADTAPIQDEAAESEANTDDQNVD